MNGLTDLDIRPDIRTHPVEDIAPPCDLGSMDEPCSNPAKWIMRPVPCCVGALVPRLACDSCKEARMTSEEGVLCVDCEQYTAPARHAYASIEAI